MNSITIVSVIRRPPGWVDTAVDEYRKRLSNDVDLKIIDIPPAMRTKNSVTKNILRQEAEAFLRAIPHGSYTIALDEKGAKKTTRNLSEKLEEWQNMSQAVYFIIGGADGIDASFKSMANEIWSLSDLTLPHAMVRVILVEQLYRAYCILKNHPYHRE